MARPSDSVSALEVSTRSSEAAVAVRPSLDPGSRVPLRVVARLGPMRDLDGIGYLLNHVSCDQPRLPLVG